MRAAEVMRRRMRNTGLVGTSPAAPEEVVRRHVAMQAQDYAPAKWSIGRRAKGISDADVDAAVADGSIVRTHALRPTWHFVAREDLRWVLALTGPRILRGSAGRLRELGLDARTLRRCERVLARELEGGNHLARDGIADALRRARVDVTGQRLPWMLIHAELAAVICSGPRSGSRHTYALVDERVGESRELDRDEALVELTRRYLQSHAPASVRDLGWWSSLTISDVRRALAALESDVVAETVESVELWRLASDDRPPPSARGVRLLQAYDELVVGYTESRYLGDPGRDAANAAWRDRSLPNGVLIVNGEVRGRWRRTKERSGLRVEVVARPDLAPPDARALDAEINRLSRFVGEPVHSTIRRR